jgi:hypothetical protein
MKEKIKQLLTDLKRIQLQSNPPRVFGADAHGFIANPPLTEDDVAVFEAAYGVALPEEYRLFLLLVGNGGAGPYYGMFRLGEVDDGFGFASWGAGSLMGEIAKPFPHTSPWNDLDSAPNDEDNGDEDYERACERFEERYFNSVLMNGAIPICHLGCAQRLWLVVTGPEAGNVWRDDRADRGGIYPLTASGKERVTFYHWYRDWLDMALKAS